MTFLKSFTVTHIINPDIYYVLPYISSPDIIGT